MKHEYAYSECYRMTSSTTTKPILKKKLYVYNDREEKEANM